MNVLFGFLLLLTPLRFETGRFTILQDGRKLGFEDYTITPRRGGYVVEGHTVLTEGGQTVDLRCIMELNEALQTTAYQFHSATSAISLRVGSPSSQFEYTVNGQRQGDDVRFPPDGAIIDSNFFHHYAILLYRIAAAPAIRTVPAFVPQQLELGPITVKSLGNNTFEIDTGNVRATATTDKDGRLIRLAVPAAKVVVERSVG